MCSCSQPQEWDPQGCFLPPPPCRAHNCCVNTQQLPCEPSAASPESILAGAAQGHGLSKAGLERWAALLDAMWGARDKPGGAGGSQGSATAIGTR